MTKGRLPGVFTSWEECNAQVKGFPGGKFMGFFTREEADAAWAAAGESAEPIPEAPLQNSLVTKATWHPVTKAVEYQGAYYPSREVVFRVGPYQHGTNYLAEFLAIVHALAYCKQQGLALPVYSESQPALDWVRQGAVRTSYQRTLDNQPLFALVDRAEAWLKGNTYPNPLLRWYSRQWGENPADFGR
ncbi:ribonuclease H family protein [Hymenobacter koreensis]|uniref:ribonuclease H family protein n=1 Tax=Hymenobacter koreensis TaxID=1084523 RepID=UPI0031ECC327